ncbi:MAG: hypothetical protein LUC85_01755 [Bacteroidales bacterium]|nr:hypothetical protein [Bacteroidales bacterium]MCD8393542.1 hypothetical protein [Bacteroidales bacterium]
MEERGHGNHWGIFGEPEDVLGEAMKNLNRHQHSFDYGNVVMREFGNKEVSILGIIDAPGKISTLALVACNVNGGRRLCCYPLAFRWLSRSGHRATSRLSSSTYGVKHRRRWHVFFGLHKFSMLDPWLVFPCR